MNQYPWDEHDQNLPESNDGTSPIPEEAPVMESAPVGEGETVGEREPVLSQAPTDQGNGNAPQETPPQAAELKPWERYAADMGWDTPPYADDPRSYRIFQEKGSATPPVPPRADLSAEGKAAPEPSAPDVPGTPPYADDPRSYRIFQEKVSATPSVPPKADPPAEGKVEPELPEPPQEEAPIPQEAQVPGESGERDLDADSKEEPAVSPNDESPNWEKQREYDPVQGLPHYYPYNPYTNVGEEPRRPWGPVKRGPRVFLTVMTVLASVFFIGFLIWGAILSTEVYTTPLPGGNTISQTEHGGGQQNVPPENPGKGNPVGTAINPSYAGLVLEPPAAAQLEPKEIYSKIDPAIVGIVSQIQDTKTGQEGTAMASGILITADGYLVTNAHVVGYSRTSPTKVVLNDKAQYDATVVGYDSSSDLAVLKIDASGLTPAVFGSSDALSVGDWVFAIGNPKDLNFSGTLTRGIVSALNRAVSYNSTKDMTYIQTDAAINPGNSGGALVNMYGQVVGINSAKVQLENYEGMGFSIPVSKAKSIIDDLIRQGYVGGKVRIGLTGLSLNATQAEQYGVPQGVLIVEINDDSPLLDTDAMEGDVITAIDGNTITSMDDVYTQLRPHKPGDKVTLSLYREGLEDTLEVTIELLADKGETQK